MMTTSTAAAQASESSSAADSHDAHPRPHYDDIKTPTIVLIGVIAAILTYLIIVFVQGLTYHWENALIKQRVFDVTNSAVVKIQSEQKNKLSGDAESGLPAIDEAMQEVVKRYQQRGTQAQP